jgi:hypothetical protein
LISHPNSRKLLFKIPENSSNPSETPNKLPKNHTITAGLPSIKSPPNYPQSLPTPGYNNSKSLENMNDSDDMDVDVSPMSSKSIKSGIERMLELGRELLQMSLRLEKKYQNVNDEIIAQNRKMMEVSDLVGVG